VLRGGGRETEVLERHGQSEVPCFDPVRQELGVVNSRTRRAVGVKERRSLSCRVVKTFSEREGAARRGDKAILVDAQPCVQWLERRQGCVCIGGSRFARQLDHGNAHARGPERRLKDGRCEPRGRIAAHYNQVLDGGGHVATWRRGETSPQ
jgi:hypothetical protein